jgi:hypothetical protein
MLAATFPKLPLLLVALALLGCNSPQQQSPSQAQPEQARQDSRASSLPSRDLSQDEAAGGHTLRKHVGRTDEQLRERLRRERNISASSTWNDRPSAEAAVGAAIAQQSSRINRWLERQNGHPNLVLDYDGDPSHPFGRSLPRGQDQVEPCAHATIVLKWDGPNAYHVLTAYPECRERQ